MNTAPPDRWVRHPAAGIARAVLATLVGLLVWSVLPVVLGWQPTVVVSGSMEPAIRTGDVVVTREVPAPDLRPGHVLLVDDPVRAGSRLLHRYDHADDGGGLVLRGDANERADSTPVRSDDVIGVGVLRVPWVGLPYVWASQGKYLTVGVTAVALLALLALSPIRERARPEEEDSDDAPPAPTSDRSRAPLAAVAGAAAMLVVGSLAHPVISAEASFTSAASMGATFSAAATFPDPDPARPYAPERGEAEPALDIPTEPAPAHGGTSSTSDRVESIDGADVPVGPEVPATPDGVGPAPAPPEAFEADPPRLH